MGLPQPPLNGTEKWAKLLQQFGLPTVLLGIFVWFVFFRMMTVFDKITTEMDAQTAALQRIEAQMKK